MRIVYRDESHILHLGNVHAVDANRLQSYYLSVVLMGGLGRDH
ncbi:hypothetical protein ABZV29_30230 [Streptomyces sp. NPDC005236]